MTPVFANILQPLIDAADWLLLRLHDTWASTGACRSSRMTVIVRLAIVPLTIKQIKSMNALRALQPQIKEIQEKYKGDRQAMNQAMMRFYQENKVNPFSSCLPLLLQLPVFMSLFYLLRSDEFSRRVEESGAAVFLFINDLAAKAHRRELVVLMVLFIGSQVASTMVMSVSVDKTQQRIMLMLPLFFAALIPNFPAGLILYWITTNFWTLGQQLVVRRLSPPPVPATVARGKPPRRTDKPPATRRRRCPSASGQATARRPRPRRGRRSAAQVTSASGAEADGSGRGRRKQSGRREVGGDEAARAALPGPRRGAGRVRGAGGAPGRRRCGGGLRAGRGDARTSPPGGTAEKEFAWPDEPRERVREIVRRTISYLGVRASVDVEETEDEVRANVSGPDLGLVIGKHGHTIDSLQFLCGQAAFRGIEERKRVVIDAGGYRERRESVLQRQADRGVADALRYGRAVELDSMGAAERKVVHMYLKDARTCRRTARATSRFAGS